MNRTSFFRGLVIGLFVSSFLWVGIVYSTSKVVSTVKFMMQKEIVQQDYVQQIPIATSEVILAKK